MAKYKLTINTTFTSIQQCTRSQAGNSVTSVEAAAMEFESFGLLTAAQLLICENHINYHILTLEELNLIQYEIIKHLQLQRQNTSCMTPSTINTIMHISTYIHMYICILEWKIPNRTETARN